MRNTLTIAALALALLQLQGCVPVIIAGAGAGALVASDRRSTGTYIEDKEIQVRAGSRIGEAFPNNTHVNITSFNRNVLLTGEVPTGQAQQKIAEIAKGVGNVRTVYNETVVGPVSLLSSRTNDSYITTKVKTRFLDAKRFQVNYVTVVTEAGVVYLMGLVTAQEADDAAQIASTTSGVTKVVKLFEIIP
jgi:osmotically-inducible protein OsmY